MVDTLVAGRVRKTRRTGWLLLGDLLIIALFVGLGELRHGGEVVDWAITFGEFGLAWVAVAVPMGAYSRGPDRSTRWTVGVISGSWVIAATLGWAIRAILEPFATFSVVFLMVMVGTGLLFLLPWRVLIAPRLLSP